VTTRRAAGHSQATAPIWHTESHALQPRPETGPSACPGAAMHAMLYSPARALRIWLYTRLRNPSPQYRYEHYDPR